MIDIFDNKPLDLNNIVCHSGGAVGADTEWEIIGKEFGVITRAYSYKTAYHVSDKYMNLLARNWSQVKYSDQILAIGYIVKKGEKNTKGYYNKGKFDMVDGGTGYAVQMAINHQKEVYVFDQIRDRWFRWSYSVLSYVESDCPKISYQNFAGIGTREIKSNGIQAIRAVFNKTFSK